MYQISVFSPNTGKYELEKAPHLDNFCAGHINTYTHIHKTTHIQIHTYYTNTHIYTYVKQFVTCFEIPNTQILHPVATS